jgi:hypothetical protein
MIILKPAFLFLFLLCGCDSSLPLFDRESKTNEAELSKHSVKQEKPKQGIHSFTQDLNKSYKEVKGRWVQAVPLHEYNVSNPSLLWNE